MNNLEESTQQISRPRLDWEMIVCLLLVTLLAGVVGLSQSDDPKVHYGGPNTLQVWSGPVCLCKNYILITQTWAETVPAGLAVLGVQH